MQSKKGLDIDSIEFIRGFFQFGLLSDVGHGVGYSLPFLESYLLAEKLTRDPAMASRYFNPSSDDFDEYTFDLYCELGPCLGVVQHVVQFAQTSFAKCATSKNILSTREIKPSALRTPQSLVSLAKRMSDATVKITAEASSSKVRVEKQKLIDTRQKVTATVGADKKKLRAEPPAELKEEFALLDDLSRSCTLLATMIGAGAERLNSDCKREISKLLLQCSERFLDLWTRNRARLDFVEIRKELLSDKSVKSMKKQLGSFDDEDLDVRQILSLFIDDQELRILSSPLATILHRIASYAGVRSLRPIVLKLKTDSALEEIIRGSWMMEIDPDAGRSLVKAAFQAFKGSPVARLTTANHLMWRIFWHHWQSASRRSFASAAKAILAPLQIVPTADHSAKMLEGHRAANN